MPTKATVTSTMLISMLLGKVLVYSVLLAFMHELLCSCNCHYMVFINHVFLAAYGRYTSLLMPGHDPPQDITIFMDVSLHPGPDLTGSWLLHDQFSTSQVVGCHSHTNLPLLTMKYSRKFLRSLLSTACTPCPQVLGKLKSHGVPWYGRGKGVKKT